MSKHGYHARHARREPDSQEFFDMHHYYWPKTLYPSRLERRFRELTCHKVKIHRREHNDLHYYDAPPEKPSMSFMIRTLQTHENGDCSICNEGGFF